MRTPSATPCAQPPPAANTEASALRGLNEAQRAAATHGSGPLLIVAGAGTGKTTTLAHRVAHLIAEGMSPGRILLLTFTRRAAEEMLRRVDSLLRTSAGPDGMPSAVSGARAWGGTFHAVATRLLRIHGESIGLPPGFTILDRPDSEDLMHAVRTSLDIGTKARRFPQKATCLDIYSRCVNAAEPLDCVLKTRFPWCRDDADDLKRLFAGYVDRKESRHVLDYDDLLLFWRGMLADPALGEIVRGHFDAVLVDEYQDTNALQADIVALLRPDGTGITAVGDDAQAIYGFRAATVRNILDFPARFEGATVLALEQNYRSTAPVLDATNAVIAEAAERYEKNLWTAREGGSAPALVTCRDEHEQTAYVIERILGHREEGTPLKEQAVLFRAMHHSMELELELQRRNIPFVKYGGLKFVEMAHVKDLVAFLRLAENPNDEIAALRVLGLLPGIGPRTASTLTEVLTASGGDFEAWVGSDVPSPARPLWPAFVALMRALASAPADEVGPQLSAARTFYAPLAEQRYDNAQARLADLEQVEMLGSRFASRSSFLTELTLDAPQWTGGFAGPPLLDEDYLILSTMHSAKGLEFDVVYVIHAADGSIPSDMSTGSVEEIEEERRLFYVACTRARDALYVTHPLRYYAAGRGRSDAYGYAQRTRFVPDRLRPLFAECQAAPSEGDIDAPAAVATTTADIRASVRAMWG
ncbi:MAG: ATP-dependent helicase [Actinobacteria bacterium]|nr:ATP-dependent helicase [Actinomycetota bacterium]